jgi:hypothetical protein
MITITRRDALKAETVQPGTYLGECVSYTQATASKDSSLLHKFEIEVDTKGMKIPLKDYQISEKAISMGKAFFIACGFPPEKWEALVAGELPDINLDPNDCVGKKFKVVVINTTYNNRVQSEAADFYPPGK